MNEKSDAINDQLPDRLSSDPKSPFYDEAVLSRDVGIRFKGVEKTNVEEYCVSEGWVRVTAGNAKDRYGNPLTIKVHGRSSRISATRAQSEAFRHCERSEAIHCRITSAGVDCFVATAPRNDG